MTKVRRNNILVVAVVVVLVIVGVFIWHRSRPTKSAIAPAKQPNLQAPTSMASSKDYTTKLLFIGDVMLARSIGQKVVAGQNPFAYVQKTLDSYDLRFANLETTMANPKLSIQASGKLFTFNSPLAGVDLLKKAHIDAVSLANNHTRDYGAAATADTIANLQTAGIKIAGAGKNIAEAFKPLIINLPLKSGESTQTLRLAIVALDAIENNFTNVSNGAAGSAYFDKTLDAAAIKLAQKQADVVVVFPHWGVEYRPSASAEQVAWGHFFIDSGADVVIGGHPHVVEPTVKYRGKYIVYSMGNFIFDQMEGPPSLGQMIGLTIKLNDTTDPNGNRTQKVTIGSPKSIPTKLDSSGFPHIL